MLQACRPKVDSQMSESAAFFLASCPRVRGRYTLLMM